MSKESSDEPKKINFCFCDFYTLEFFCRDIWWRPNPSPNPKPPFPRSSSSSLLLLLLFTLDVLTFPSFPYSTSVYLYAMPETHHAGPSRLMGLYPTPLLSIWGFSPSTGTHLSHKLATLLQHLFFLDYIRGMFHAVHFKKAWGDVLKWWKLFPATFLRTLLVFFKKMFQHSWKTTKV